MTPDPRIERLIYERPEAQGSASGKMILVDPKTDQRFLFKPSAGETAIVHAMHAGIHSGTYARRSAAAHEVAKMLGVDTPAVQIVVYKGRLGALQELVDGKSPSNILCTEGTRAFDGVTRDPNFKRVVQEIRAFDYLLDNLDRNPGNYLVTRDRQGAVSRVVAIDHDLTFKPGRGRTEPGFYTDSIHGLPKEYSPRMRARLLELAQDPERLRAALTRYLTREEVDGVLDRLKTLVAHLRQTPAQGGP